MSQYLLTVLKWDLSEVAKAIKISPLEIAKNIQKRLFD